MDAGAANGLKKERNRRKRIAAIRKMIMFTVAIWFLLSMVICIGLLLKVRAMESKLNYLLDNFTVSGQMDAESKNTVSKAEESQYFDLEQTTEAIDLEENYEIVHAVNQEENMAGPDDVHKVYLTFDDGPSSNTVQILDILKENDVKATFFVIGREDEASKALYQRIVDEGHTLAMHSFTHKYSTLYSSMEAFEEDFSRIQNYLYEVTGKESLFYRFPGGSSNHVSNENMKEFISFLNRRQITYFDWNVSSGDATSQAYAPEELIENVMEDVKKYKTSVVLMHDSVTKTSTVKALGPMIQELKNMGARLLPIDESTTVVQHIAAASAEQ